MIEKQPNLVSGIELWQWQQQAKKAAINAEVSINEVDWLLTEVAGLDRLALRLESFKDKASIHLHLPFEVLKNLWQKRLIERLPVQYIAGVTHWRQFHLKVSPAVLIPRPETEILIDLVQSLSATSPSLQKGHWADLGTGSGALALGLASVFPDAQIHAVDYSDQALTIAKENIHSYCQTNRISLYQGSWWQPLENLKGQFSGMVSNPPYIPSNTVLTLQPEVVNHEPHLALDGGDDGLNAIRELVEKSPKYLQSGGLWLIEMMAGQADDVAKLLRDQGCYENIQIYPDLAGIYRFAIASRKLSR